MNRRDDSQFEWEPIIAQVIFSLFKFRPQNADHDFAVPIRMRGFRGGLRSESTYVHNVPVKTFRSPCLSNSLELPGHQLLLHGRRSGRLQRVHGLFHRPRSEPGAPGRRTAEHGRYVGSQSAACQELIAAQTTKSTVNLAASLSHRCRWRWRRPPRSPSR